MTPAASLKISNHASHTSSKPSTGMAKVQKAIQLTQQRLHALEGSGPTKKTRRLTDRLAELNHLKGLVEKGVDFKGFSGWGEGSEMIKSTAHRPGRSQYDSIVLKERGKLVRYPLASRVQRSSGREIDLVQQKVSHGNHSHDQWQTIDGIKKVLEKSLLIMGEQEEGCPCCLAGLDFDEFAVALKEIGTGIGDHGHGSPIADLTSATHWGIFLGLSGPFSLIGLTAAIRNIKGTRLTVSKISEICAALKKDIAATKAQGNHEAADKMKAFYNTLRYSYFDNRFNFWVPGVINGVASSLVLSSLVIDLPLALPAIALYAGCQTARNAYDLKRVCKPDLKATQQDDPDTAQGKQKVNQVMQSKRRFTLSNAIGFSVFTAGAALTFASLPLFGLGIGAVTLPVGLAMLTLGAASTGYMNNVWPRKFKPRNGELGISRLLLDGKRCLQEVARRRQNKLALKPLRKTVSSSQPWARRWLVFKSAMPELADFLPASWARRAKKIKWLPVTGSSVNQLIHDFDRARAAKCHESPAESVNVQKQRLACLQTIVGQEQNVDGLSEKERLLLSWQYLGKLGVQGDFIENWLSESGYQPQKNDHSHDHGDSCGHACSHQHHHAPTSHMADAGFRQKHRNWVSFNFHHMLAHLKESDLPQLNAAIDFYLGRTYFGRMRYQQYGLIDFFNQLRAS